MDAIGQTRNWILQVVIGCNFCPFAARVIKKNSIHFTVVENSSRDIALSHFLDELERMDNDEAVETTLIILTSGFEKFEDYLDLVDEAEYLLKKKNYEGIYQLASFHPAYRFADSTSDDPANFTNRSPYPLLHILREDSITEALEKYKEPGNIPENNIRFAREKGIEYMKQLLQKSME